MTEPTTEEYMMMTGEDYGSGISRPKFDKDAKFKLKGHFLKELHDNTFSGSENKDENKHIERVLETVDLFTTPDVTQDQLMLHVFPISLTRAASRWMEEINSFQQDPNMTLYQAWERFMELLLRYDTKKAIKEMAAYSQKWHDGTSSRNKNSNTSDGLAAIQAQLNNHGREIKKVYERVYAAQVGCELCNGQHYSKDCPLKKEAKTLEEAYYTQFGVPFPNAGRYRAAAPRFYQRDNGNPSYQERRQTKEESLSKFMVEPVKRHDEHSSFIKEIKASTDATIRN
ncbi:hypothetical protein Tco_1017136 [Tanacetum coccineum]|uniref:Retrotransposon gag domain-containing protein n=1 Tax=Tanacetum coccineum TaxID=301880 RepID=A0ABQ5FQQ6_9ASTR